MRGLSLNEMRNGENVMGRKIIITGASSGIGLAIARKFMSKEPAEIHNISRTICTVMGTQNHKVDFTNEQHIDKAIDLVQTIKPDILINCAGIMPLKYLKDIDHELYNKIMDVNVRAPYFLCVAAAQSRETNIKIVNIASISGFANDDPDLVLYNMSKAGVIMLTRSMAKLFPQHNINSVSPGLTRGTNLVPGEPDPPQDLIDKVPMKRPAETFEIADLVYFLCSGEARFISGANYVIDGGQSA